MGRSLLVVTALAVALFASLVGLSQLKYTSFVSDSISGRLQVVASAAAQDLAAAIDLGLSVEQVANGSEILERTSRHDRAITAMYVTSLDGVIVHATGNAPTLADDVTLEAFRVAVEGFGEPTWVTEAQDTIRFGTVVEGTFGQPVGGVVVEYHIEELDKQSRAMTGSLVKIGVLVTIGVVIGAGLVLVLASRRRHKGNERGPAEPPGEIEARVVTGIISGILIIGVVSFGMLAVPAFNSALAPELERRAGLIGETIRDETARAISVGIPITEFVGVDEYFSDYLERFPELNSLAILTNDVVLYSLNRRDASGQEVQVEDSIVYQFGDSALQEEGVINVGVDSRFVNSRLRDLALDMVVILLVSLVALFEVVRVASRRLSPSAEFEPGGLRGASPERGVANIRMVLFLFVVGEGLNKSFLPLFIEASDNPLPFVSTSLAVSLPIASYLLAVALASPFAGRLISSVGKRGLFLIGALAAASSHLGMVFAGNVVQIVGLRTITGIGYALVTIVGLDYILDRVGSSGRAQGIGAFVAVVIGGTFVGTALGGIIADRLGYSTVFLISFGLVAVAGLMATKLITDLEPEGVEERRVLSLHDVRLVLRQPSLMLLMAGVTVPMNVLLAAFIWFLVPLAMSEIGSTAAEIGRALMIYYLAILVGSPAAARASAIGMKSWALVGVGSVIAATALLLPAVTMTVMTLSVAVLVVGIGHAAIRGPQIDLALEIAEKEMPTAGRDPVLAAIRMLERLGSLVGLLAVAVLVGRFDYGVAFAAVSIVSLSAGLVYLSLRRKLSRSYADV